MKKYIWLLLFVVNSAFAKDIACQIHYSGIWNYKGYEDKDDQRLVCDNGVNTPLWSETLSFVDFRSGNAQLAKTNKGLIALYSSDFIENKKISGLLNKYNVPFIKSRGAQGISEIGLQPVIEHSTGAFANGEGDLTQSSEVDLINTYQYCKSKKFEGKPVYAMVDTAWEGFQIAIVTLCISSEISNVEGRQLAESIVSNLGKPDVLGKPKPDHGMNSGIDGNFPMAFYTIKHNEKYLIVRITRSPYTIQVTDLTQYVQFSSANIKKDIDF